MSKRTAGDIRPTVNYANAQIDNLNVSTLNGSSVEGKQFVTVNENPQNQDILRYDSASTSWKPVSTGPSGSQLVTTQDTERVADDLVPVFNGMTGQSVKTSKIQIISESTNFDYIRNVANPILDNDATNKLYVDTLALTGGITFGEPVFVASTGNLVLSGIYVIDGISVVAGKRILVKNQTNSTENGVYVSAAGAWSRSSEEALGTTATGKTFAVDDGTVNGGDLFTCNTDSANFGDAITFVRIASFGDINGPTFVSDNAIVRWNGIDGKRVQNSTVQLSDNGEMTGIKSLGLKDTSDTGTATIQTPVSITDYSVTIPGTQGGVGTYLKNDGTGTLSWSTPGDISGPVSSVDNTIPRFDGTTGKVVQGSGVSVSDTADMVGMKSLGLKDTAGTGVLTIQTPASITDYSVTLPGTQGGVGTYLKNDGVGMLSWSTPGDISGPVSSVDNTIPRFDGTTGKVVQGSGVSVSDTADMVGMKSLGLDGDTSGRLTLRASATTTSHSLTFPESQGGVGTYLKNDGIGNLVWDKPGDVVGPVSSVDNTIARFDGTTGKIVQGSGVSVSDTADVGGVNTLGLKGSTTGTLSVQAPSTVVDYSFTFPSSAGASGSYLKTAGLGVTMWDTPGDVKGPVSSVDNTIARFDGISGKIVQGSGVSVSDTAEMVGMKTLGMKDTAGTGTLTIQTPSSITDYSITLPGTQGATDTYLRNDGSGVISWNKPGDVYGSNSSTDKSIVRYNGTTGKNIQDSTLTISDLGNLVGMKSLGLKDTAGVGTVTIQTPASITDYSVTLPGTQGGADTYLKNNGTGTLSWGIPPGGDVGGPVSSVDNTIVRFDGTTGKVIQGSGVSVSDTADVGGVNTLGLKGSTTGTLSVQAPSSVVDYSFIFPSSAGASGSYLKTAGLGVTMWDTPGDVKGPVTSVDNTIARFDGTTGKIVQGSGVSVSDTADMVGVKTLGLSGATSGALTVQTAATTTSHTLTFPGAQGGVGTYLKNDGTGTLSWNAVGDVVGPGSSVDNTIARFDGATGKVVQGSGVSVSDTADMVGMKTLGMKDTAGTGVLTIQTPSSITDYSVTLPGTQGGVGTYLQNNGSGILSWAGISVAGGGLKNMQVFQNPTNAGTGTYTYTPTAGTTRALVYVTGGGGAGGGVTSGVNNQVGGGGSGGGTAVGFFLIDDTKTGSITVGQGGTGDTGSGNTGGSSSFQYPDTGVVFGTLTGQGGGGGAVKGTGTNDRYFSVPGSPGGSLSSALNAYLLQVCLIEGIAGTAGITIDPDIVMAGSGGASVWGGGPYGRAINNTNTSFNGINAEVGTGSGGSGAAQTNNNGTTRVGGDGGSGRVVIYEY